MNLDRIGLMGAVWALATVLSASSSFAQTPPPEQTPAEPRAQQEMARVVEGTLESVNATTKTLVVKTAAGKEETLRYDDSTEIVGGESGVAGLANSKGTDVTVKFRGSGADRVASKIKIREPKS